MKARLVGLARHAKEHGGGVAVTRLWKRGTINYTRIPELDGIDLQYRGPAREEGTVLFHRDAVGARGACRKSRVEVEVEPRILGQRVVRDLDDVNLVIAFEMNDACSVLVEKIVRDDEATVVAAQHQVMWAGVLAEADD